MLYHKRRIAIFMYLLTLLITLSAFSTGSAHAADKVPHAKHSKFTQLKPLSEGPPGCDAIEIGYWTTNVNYSGHKFIVENQLLGWYSQGGGEQLHFCDQILCVADVSYNGGSPVPAGILGIYCGGYGALTPVTKRSNPTTGGDGITNEATVSPGYVTSCAQYWVGGRSGPAWNTGGGCTAGQVLRSVPATL